MDTEELNELLDIYERNTEEDLLLLVLELSSALSFYESKSQESIIKRYLESE